MEETLIEILEDNGISWSDVNSKLVVLSEAAKYYGINTDTFQRMLERNSEKMNVDVVRLKAEDSTFCSMKNSGCISPNTPTINVLSPLGMIKACFLTDGVKQRKIKDALREKDIFSYLLISSYFSEEFINRKYQKELSYLIDSVFSDQKVEHEKTIGVFRVDFLINNKVVIECDESKHKYYPRDFEEKRENYLKNNGYVILRYKTDNENMLGFLGVIARHIYTKEGEQE